MKRSEALAILSRDHQHALSVAQHLRRATAGTAAAERDRFLEFWVREGRHHFQLEEEVLFPAYALHGDPHHPLLLRALGDHVAIRAQATRLAQAPQADVGMLLEMGVALSAHVRLEERELFGLIERAMGANALLALATELEGAELGAGVGRTR